MHLTDNFPSCTMIDTFARIVSPLLCCAALFGSSIASIGCNQTHQDSEVEATDAKVESDQDEDLTKIAIDSLIRRAGAALHKNDVPSAKSIASEILRRDNVDVNTQMEVARILYACGEMKEAAKVYDQILESVPNLKPQLWQRGLALYYSERFKDAVDQFDSHQTYNSQDVENAVWHLLCKAKLSSIEEARKSMIQIKRDTRVPMKQVFDMFSGTGSPEEVLKAAGYNEEKTKRDSSIYHGLLYVGLFHEMNGDAKASSEAMVKALKHKPYMTGLMGHVAEGHLRARKAYPSEPTKK